MEKFSECAFGVPGNMTRCYFCCGQHMLRVANVLDATPHTKKQCIVYKPKTIQIQDWQFGETSNVRELPRITVDAKDCVIIDLTQDPSKEVMLLQVAASLAALRFVCVFKRVTTDAGGFAWLGEKLILLRAADISDAFYLCNVEHEPNPAAHILVQ